MVELSGVSETLLIPLYARYQETLRDEPAIFDSKAVEIVEALNLDLSRFENDWSVTMAVVVRTHILDEAVKGFIEKNPECLIVNIAAGLCTRYFRVDNGQLQWFNLDLPQVHKVWQDVFDESERYKFLAYSVLDFEWLNEVQAFQHRPTLFIIEGLFMYLSESEVQDILFTLKSNFPGADVLLEAYSPIINRFSFMISSVAKTGSRFNWGVRSGRELEKWGLTFLHEWYYLNYFPKRWRWMALSHLFPITKTFLKMIHIKLSG